SGLPREKNHGWQEVPLNEHVPARFGRQTRRDAHLLGSVPRDRPRSCQVRCVEPCLSKKTPSLRYPRNEGSLEYVALLASKATPEANLRPILRLAPRRRRSPAAAGSIRGNTPDVPASA